MLSLLKHRPNNHLICLINNGIFRKCSPDLQVGQGVENVNKLSLFIELGEIRKDCL